MGPRRPLEKWPTEGFHVAPFMFNKCGPTFSWGDHLLGDSVSLNDFDNDFLVFFLPLTM